MKKYIFNSVAASCISVAALMAIGCGGSSDGSAPKASTSANAPAKK